MIHMSENTKTCGLCGLKLQLKFFTPDDRTSDKLSTYCVDCQDVEKDLDDPMNPMKPWLTQMVHCRRCGDFKPRDQFTPSKRTKTGCYTWCRTCWRGYQNNRNYKRGKSPTIKEAILARIRVLYGEDATPVSVIRGNYGIDTAAFLRTWFSGYSERYLQKQFYELCLEETKNANLPITNIVDRTSP